MSEQEKKQGEQHHFVRTEHYPVQDSRDVHEVPQVIAATLEEKDRFKFTYGVCKSTFTWENGELKAVPADEDSDIILRGKLLDRIRDYDFDFKIILSDGEEITK